MTECECVDNSGWWQLILPFTGPESRITDLRGGGIFHDSKPEPDRFQALNTDAASSFPCSRAY